MIARPRKYRTMVRVAILAVILAVTVVGCNHILSLMFLGDFNLTYRSWVGARAVSDEQPRSYSAELAPTTLGSIRHTITPTEFTLFIPRVEFHSTATREAWVVVVAYFPDVLDDQYYQADFVNEASHVYPPRGRAGTMDLLQIVVPGGGPVLKEGNPYDGLQLPDDIVFTLPPEYDGVALSPHYGEESFSRDGLELRFNDYRALAEPAMPEPAPGDVDHLPETVVLGTGFETRVHQQGTGEEPFGAWDDQFAPALLASLGEPYEIPLNASGYDVDVEFDYEDVIVIWDNGTDDLSDDVVSLAPAYWERFRISMVVK